MRLENQVVLLTGANRGIGRALALELARCGARLALAGLEEAELDDLHREIEAIGGRAITRVCDVRVESDVEALLADVFRAYERVDVLINNAGITSGGDIQLISDEEWERVFDVNLWGAIRTVRSVAPHMVERGSGHIVNISSAAGLIAPALWIPYATSKFSLVGFSEGLCAALRPKGVRVSLVCPMWVRTEMDAAPSPRLADPPWRRPGRSGPVMGRWWKRLSKRLPGRQMKPEVAARRIVRGIERGRFLIYTHAWLRLLVLARAAAPETFSRLWDRVNAADEERYRLDQEDGGSGG